jgi:hypothetical protein
MYSNAEYLSALERVKADDTRLNANSLTDLNADDVTTELLLN